MDLVILTTAICRPSVHDQVFPPLITALEKSPKVGRVYHFINVDQVTGRERSNSKKTIQNLENLFTDSTKIERFYSTGDPPCFFNAVKTLATKVNDFLQSRLTLVPDQPETQPETQPENRIGFLLFEDDWLPRCELNFDEILGHLTENMYILLAKGAEISQMAYQFRPSLWSLNLFKEIYLNSIFNIKELTGYELGDPEIVVREGSRKYHGAGGSHEFRHFPIFYDVGREWADRNKIRKWKKKVVHSHSVTYQ